MASHNIVRGQDRLQQQLWSRKTNRANIRRCSAAAQGDFDVRWLRGSASDLIFAPWLRAIEEDGGQVLGGKRVSTIRFKDTTAAASTDSEDTKSSSGVVGGAKGGGAGDAGGEETKASTSSGVVGGTKDAFLGGEGGADGGCGSGGMLAVETTDGQVFEADAVVLAVGITAAKVRPPHKITPKAHPELHTPITRQTCICCGRGPSDFRRLVTKSRFTISGKLTWCHVILKRT